MALEKKAEKDKKEKKNFLALAAKEYKYEGLILLILALIGLVLGVEILIGATSNGESGLVVDENFFIIGEYPKAFAWVLIVLGSVSIVLAIWPYFKPSIGELKRVTWPTKKVMLENTLITFAFILIIALLFVGYDAILNKVVELFQWLADKMH